MLTQKQQSLISSNYLYLPYEMSSDIENILAIVHMDVEPEDAFLFCRYIFNLANKRPHEWMTGEREENIKNLKYIIQKYAGTTSNG